MKMYGRITVAVEFSIKPPSLLCSHISLNQISRRNLRAKSSFTSSGSDMVVSDDMDAFLQILPYDLRENLLRTSKQAKLIEVVLDLGRLPEARYAGRSVGDRLRDKEVSARDLEHVQCAVGEFGGDNRAGIEGTLHRISAIRSRSGVVVGLTCRVGRAVTGYINMVHDLLQFGESILFVGRPGVGKTTVMREISRVLSDELHKRVVIVDTSNEIGGVGDVPHSSIGGARRLQVPEPSMQRRIMIEAVENHMPQVIIVDEIGTEAEVQACRSIAERGVMLIGTAHGERLENLIKNPTLSDLIGGVKSVTLGDQEARTRNCKKCILERKASPTFPFLIEMRERHYWIAHRTERSVDFLLNGKKPLVELTQEGIDSELCQLFYNCSKSRKVTPIFGKLSNALDCFGTTVVPKLIVVRRRDRHFNVVTERWRTED